MLVENRARFHRVRSERSTTTPTAPEGSLGPRRRFRFRVGPMADVTTVRATVASTNDGYAVAVVLEKGGQFTDVGRKDR